MNLNQYFKHITIIDQTVDLKDQLLTDQTLALNLEPQKLVIRFWSTEGVIFGKLDTLLPEFEKGFNTIQNAGYKTLVRKAGGLAVVCDSGILNLSILYSKDTPFIGGLNESYTFGVDLIRYLLEDMHLDIEVGEVSTSYCPGKYDLSVNGKKFSGMAQYRSKNAVMLLVTLCVNGDQQNRCELIKEFYNKANPNKDAKYPQINVSSMKTLSTLSDKDITVVSLKESMKHNLTKIKLCENMKQM